MNRPMLAFLLVHSVACSDDPSRFPADDSVSEDAGRGDTTSDTRRRDAATTGSGEPGGGTCARADVVVTRKPVTVWLALDDSYPMNQDAGGIDKQLGIPWVLIRNVLMGDDGVVPLYQDTVRFGFVRAGLHLDNGIAQCQLSPVSAVAPALRNYDAIAQSYAELGSKDDYSAPYYALKHVLEQTRTVPSAQRGPTVIVLGLAPGGEQLCTADFFANMLPGDLPGYQTARTLTDELVKDLVAEGLKLHVFEGIADTMAGAVHDEGRFAELATLGGTGSPLSYSDSADLKSQLASITSELVSCEVSLNGKVKDGVECAGLVQVDGKTLPCNDANGWRLKDPSTLELTGNACTELKKKPQAKLVADFPCEDFVILL